VGGIALGEVGEEGGEGVGEGGGEVGGGVGGWEEWGEVWGEGGGEAGIAGGGEGAMGGEERMGDGGELGAGQSAEGGEVVEVEDHAGVEEEVVDVDEGGAAFEEVEGHLFVGAADVVCPEAEGGGEVLVEACFGAAGEGVGPGGADDAEGGVAAVVVGDGVGSEGVVVAAGAEGAAEGDVFAVAAVGGVVAADGEEGAAAEEGVAPDEEGGGFAVVDIVFGGPIGGGGRGVHVVADFGAFLGEVGCAPEVGGGVSVAFEELAPYSGELSACALDFHEGVFQITGVWGGVCIDGGDPGAFEGLEGGVSRGGEAAIFRVAEEGEGELGGDGGGVVGAGIVDDDDSGEGVALVEDRGEGGFEIGGGVEGGDVEGDGGAGGEDFEGEVGVGGGAGLGGAVEGADVALVGGLLQGALEDAGGGGGFAVGEEVFADEVEGGGVGFAAFEPGDGGFEGGDDFAVPEEVLGEGVDEPGIGGFCGEGEEIGCGAGGAGEEGEGEAVFGVLEVGLEGGEGGEIALGGEKVEQGELGGLAGGGLGEQLALEGGCGCVLGGFLHGAGRMGGGFGHKASRAGPFGPARVLLTLGRCA